MLEDYTFGIEIEFSSPVSLREMAQLIQSATGQEIRDTGYTHATVPYWKIVPDASLNASHGHRTTGELVSPVMRGANGLEKVRAVIQALSDAGAAVNRSCGFHVHIGREDRTWQLDHVKNFIKFYAKHEHLIDAIMPTSRKASNNSFCRSTLAASGFAGQYVANEASEALRIEAINRLIDRLDAAPDINRMASAVQQGRYCKLNLTPFVDRGTIEVRHHSGTVNADKVVNWVRFLLAMMDAAQGITRFHRAKPTSRTIGEQFAEFARKFLTEDLREYYYRRYYQLIDDSDTVSGSRRTRRTAGGATATAE